VTEARPETSEDPVEPTTPAAARLRSAALPAILLASLAVKLYLAWLVRDMACVSDECKYLENADLLFVNGTGALAMKSFPGWWPPGQPFFLAACQWLLNDAASGARFVQAFVSTLTAFFIYKIGHVLYGRVAALAALVMVAFYPNLVFFSHTLWAETNYLCWFSAGIWVLVRKPRLSARDALGCGLLFGVAGLFKAMGLYFVLLVALWAVLSRRATIAVALLTIGSALLTISPWTIRNYVVYDRVVLLDRSLGANMLAGTGDHPPANYDLGGRSPPWRDRDRPRVESPPRQKRSLNPPPRKTPRRPTPTADPAPFQSDPVALDRMLIRGRSRYIRENPGRFVSLIPVKWADLVSPTSFMIRHVRRGSYPHLFDLAETRWITLLCAGSWMIVSILGVVGLTLVSRGSGPWLIWMLIGYPLVITTLTFGMSRFRLPMVPYLILASGAALAAVGSAVTGRGALRFVHWRSIVKSPRGVLTIVLLSGLVWLWTMRWDAVFDVFGRSG
jgi:hypothetical protein